MVLWEKLKPINIGNGLDTSSVKGKKISLKEINWILSYHFYDYGEVDHNLIWIIVFLARMKIKFIFKVFNKIYSNYLYLNYKHM